MKNTLLFAGLVFVFTLLLNACGITETEEYRDLEQENDSLATELRNRDQQLEAVAISMDEVESNLAAIEKNELAINTLKNEGQMKQKDKINEMIKGIDSYIDDSRKRISELEAQVKNSKSSNASLNKMVAQLKRSVAQKEAQIVELRSTINVLQVERDSLSATLALREEEINKRNEEISNNQRQIEEKETFITTAYYKVGSRKELADKGIIKKEGGVLGVGRTLSLADKLNPVNFKKINIKNVREIELGDTKKKNVVSVHPSDSYFFANSNGKVYLTISDHHKFWSVSKFLVVEVDR